MLAPVPLALVHLAPPISPALVPSLLPDGPLEEALASLAADGPVVTSGGSVSTHHAQLRALLVQTEDVGRGDAPRQLVLHHCQWGSN